MALFSRSKESVVPRRRAGDAADAKNASTETSQKTFMRNRTIRGTSATRFGEDPSERHQVHHLAATRRRVGSIFLLIVVAVIVLAGLLSQVTAESVVGLSDKDLSRQVNVNIYQKAINDYLDNHPTERLRFALNTQTLAAYVTSVNPEVKSISQHTVFGFGSTRFSVALRHPIAGWQIASKQYYVDDAGIAFEQNYFVNPTVQIIDDSGISLESGTAVTSSRFLSFVGKIVSAAKGRGYTVTQAILPVGTTRQIDIHLQDILPVVKLSIDRGAGEQIEDMDRSIKYLSSKGQSPQYIDLRIDGKAYYK